MPAETAPVPPTMITVWMPLLFRYSAVGLLSSSLAVRRMGSPSCVDRAPAETLSAQAPVPLPPEASKARTSSAVTALGRVRAMAVAVS